MPWWRVRTWGKDLETLTRLHRSLQALEAEAAAEQPHCPHRHCWRRRTS